MYETEVENTDEMTEAVSMTVVPVEEPSLPGPAASSSTAATINSPLIRPDPGAARKLDADRFSRQEPVASVSMEKVTPRQMGSGNSLLARAHAARH